MRKSCRQCAQQFEITNEDLAFYDKVSPIIAGKKYPVPPPTLCPDCRRQRRFMTRNERKLYSRKCDLCLKQVISIYSPEDKVIAYCPKCWWSDSWDDLSCGRKYDFARPFFSQYKELLEVAPRPAIHVVGCENCDYVNQCGYSKNCYLSYNTDWSENCLYCKDVLKSRDCADILSGRSCELCFDSILISNCYKVIGSERCKNSNDLYFCSNLISCSDCYGCINLRNKKYYFNNEKLVKEEYERRIKSINFGDVDEYAKRKRDSRKFFLKYPRKYAEILQSENVTGDDIYQCKDAKYCFDCNKSKDVAYCTVTTGGSYLYDCDTGGYESELNLEMISSGDGNYKSLFGANYWGKNNEAYYSQILLACSGVFGCASMRNRKHCILNKQYSAEEYENLVQKIIGQMRENGEWGEFFPMSISPYGYNETIAHEYFPLKKEQAEKLGLRWKEDDNNKYSGEKISPPDNINEVTDEHLKIIFTCRNCKKNFRIIEQEVSLYKKLNLPPPKTCNNCRYQILFSGRMPYKLYSRQCAKCGAKIQTAYAPDRPEAVYCESCYLQAIY
jgi:hypothetical protein